MQTVVILYVKLVTHKQPKNYLRKKTNAALAIFMKQFHLIS